MRVPRFLERFGGPCGGRCDLCFYFAKFHNYSFLYIFQVMFGCQFKVSTEPVELPAALFASLANRLREQ